MRKWTALLLCIALLGGLVGTASAEGLTVASTDTSMSINGKDFFDYNSSELYALWQQYGLTERKVLAFGLRPDSTSELASLWFRFKGLSLLATTNDPDILAKRSELASQPPEQLAALNFAAGSLIIEAPGIVGPYGIEVGISGADLKAKVPDLTENPKEADGVQTFVKRFEISSTTQQPIRRWLSVTVQGDVVTQYVVGATFRTPVEQVGSSQVSGSMLLDGKDIFTYTSGELYKLRQGQTGSRDDGVGYIGYGNDDMPPDTVPGLVIGFDGFAVFTESDDPDVAQASVKKALIALPLEQTAYAITEVRVNQSNIVGPFGVTVGMEVADLLAKVPDLVEQTERDGMQSYEKHYEIQTEAYGTIACSFSVEVVAGKVAEYSLDRPLRHAAPLREIQASERMLLDGKDIFSYTSGELYKLRQAKGPMYDDTIGYMGYEEDASEDDLIPGLQISFGDFVAFTHTDDPDASTVAKRKELTALPLDQTNYVVREIRSYVAGMPGPFGVQVGMTTEALLATGLNFFTRTYTDDAIDTEYSTEYQDAVSGDTFTLDIQAMDGIVKNYAVSRQPSSR